MGNRNNIVWHNGAVSLAERHQRTGHRSGVLWFTGLSASGKSTLAYGLEHRLHLEGIGAYVLDGDNIRHGLNSNLGFSKEDRDENLRRVAEVAKLFADAGIFVMAAFITPLQKERQLIREILQASNFSEVYVKCSLKECIRRDPKGSYEKALSGRIANYTGISSPYEEPSNYDLVVETENNTIDQCVQKLYEFAATSYQRA